MNNFSRLAIVTGASRGLGALITLELAAVGLDVLMVARDSVGLEHTLGRAAGSAGRVYPFVCDLEVEGAIASVVREAENLGGVEVLINNAAIQGPIGPGWDNDSEAFERVFRVNFLIPAALMRAIIPGMLVRRAGWIVNVSGGGATGPRPMFSAYGASKAALVRFAETLALETCENNVRINSIAPGAFASGMSRAILDAAEAAGAKEVESAKHLLTEGDDVNAHKAAKLIAYLVSGAGRDISGRLISAVWDPWSELAKHWQDMRDTDIYTLRRIVPADRGEDWGR
jgi:3-oxoacyl-[acyl-carrier protein] reductase